ncbi:MAG: ATP-binding cassette domain-containing protein [Sedimentisphaerales bacterium]|nr:ATP-binding cassette domain-containing protein [Sedimentisphaerales bacterium]
MTTFTLKKTFSWDGIITEKVTDVCRMFGLTIDRLKDQTKTHSCSLDIKPGDVVYITGPSGSGKSVLLHELENAIEQQDRVNISQIELPVDKAVIDCINDGLLASLQLLSTAGLSDCFCIIKKAANLSDGEKFRFRMAMAMAQNRKYIIADEFSSELDRITACAISYNIRKFAKRTGTIFMLASSHRDLLADLAPDIIVLIESSGPTYVTYRDMRRQPC